MRHNTLTSFFSSVFITLLLALTACGGGGSSESNDSDVLCSGLSAKLLGGRSCLRSDSSVVSLFWEFRPGSNQRCSGIVITKRKILTAAHCFDGLKGLPETVTIQTDTGEIQAESIVKNPNYIPAKNRADGTPVADLAIVSVAGELPVQVSSLSTSRAVSIGERLRFFSINSLNGADNSNSGVRNVALVAADLLLSRIDGQYLVTEFDKSLAGTCRGDSGGALIRENDGVVGIASYFASIDGNCSPGSESGFAALSSDQNISFLTQEASEAKFR